MRPCDKNCDEVKRRVTEERGATEAVGGKCPIGTHKIRLWIDEGEDFHFMAQDPSSGEWMQKRGEHAPETVSDPDSYQPGYDKCKGDLCVPH